MVEPSGTPLSQMQKQLLQMMNDGKGRNEIARELSISPATVRTRVEHLGIVMLGETTRELLEDMQLFAREVIPAFAETR